MCDRQQLFIQQQLLMHQHQGNLCYLVGKACYVARTALCTIQHSVSLELSRGSCDMYVVLPGLIDLHCV